jgi:uncharacterized protein (DUF885 family)
VTTIDPDRQRGPAGQAAALAELAERHFELAMTAAPFDATVVGVDGYDAEVPDLSEEAAARQRDALAELQRRLDAIDPEALGGQDRITHAMLRRAFEDRRAELAAGWPEFTVSATGASIQTAVIAVVPKVTLGTARQAADYLERCRRLEGCLLQAVERLRRGIADGRTPPERGVRAAIAQLDAYLAGPLDGDPLLAPSPPSGLDAGDWRRRLGEIVSASVRPAMGRYLTCLREEVLPRTRPDDHSGLVHLPGGEAIYREVVRAHTTTELDPEELHRLGLELLEGLADEYRALGSRVLGTDDLGEIFARLRGDPSLRFDQAAEILGSAKDALDRADAAVPGWFGRLPAAPCRIGEMSPFEAADAVLGYYQPPSADGRRPGMHWLNTSEPRSRARYEYEALAFHESVPGHHLQFALAQELEGLPRFRRFGYVTAFCEGWALYAERLADEMGLYSGDLARFGMLSFDSWRACRLVVDTGIHQFGWSRSRAIQQMLANSALTRSNVENEVDRYVATPGQALAYMVGRLELDRLRGRALARLGGRFDVRAFHDAVLGSGGVPLSVLGEEVDRWAATEGSGDGAEGSGEPRGGAPDGGGAGGRVGPCRPPTT